MSVNRFNNVSAIIVKLTSRCNIQCEYCYEHITFGKEKHYYLPMDKFKVLVEKIFLHSKKDGITIIFHGGEPSLLPISWLNEASDFVNEQAKYNKKTFKLSLQTNFINISDDLLACFKKNNISLGISIDNPDKVPNSMRPLAHKVIANYHRALALKIFCGILMTINKSNYHLFTDICHWLHNDMHVNSFKANVAYSVGAGINLEPINPEEIFAAKKSIINYIIATNAEKIIEHHICHSIIDYVECYLQKHERAYSLCDSKVCGAGKDVVGITPEGNLLPCGRFGWNDHKYFLGNIEQEETNEITIEFNEKVKAFQTIAPNNWQDCDTCQAKSICRFSCQAFIARSNSKANIECQATKLEFAYLNSIKKDVLKIYPKLKVRRSLDSLLNKVDIEQIQKSDQTSKKNIYSMLEKIVFLGLELNNSEKISKQEALFLLNHLEQSIACEPLIQA